MLSSVGFLLYLAVWCEVWFEKIGWPQWGNGSWSLVSNEGCSTLWKSHKGFKIGPLFSCLSLKICSSDHIGKWFDFYSKYCEVKSVRSGAL